MGDPKGWVPVDDSGHPVGEAHGRAKASDRDVERARELRECGLSYFEIGEKLGVNPRTVKAWCQFQRRIARPAKMAPRGRKLRWGGHIRRR